MDDRRKLVIINKAKKVKRCLYKNMLQLPFLIHLGEKSRLTLTRQWLYIQHVKKDTTYFFHKLKIRSYAVFQRCKEVLVVVAVGKFICRAQFRCKVNSNCFTDKSIESKYE